MSIFKCREKQFRWTLTNHFLEDKQQRLQLLFPIFLFGPQTKEPQEQSHSIAVTHLLLAKGREQKARETGAAAA